MASSRRPSRANALQAASVGRRSFEEDIAYHQSSSASRPTRRYSDRIGAATRAPPQANPSQPYTWDHSWANAFHQLKVDGEVYKENLVELLELIGHQSPDEAQVQSIADKVTTHLGLTATEVFDFTSKFQAELDAQIRREFDISAEDNGGKVPIADLEKLLRQRGYTPIPHSIHEVLKEAAAELQEDIGEGVTLRVFQRVNELLESREGFCKSDLDILEGAFQSFDKDKNGVIDRKELRALLESLDFCLDSELIISLVEQVQGDSTVLGWKDFLCISRKRVQLEFDFCFELFQKCDDDEDGFLQPGELMRMVSKMGLSLLPETLLDLIDECRVDAGAIDFPGFWTMLQALKAREGSTLEEAAHIHAVFLKFDSTGRGEMPLKRVPAALNWLGYSPGPGIIGKAQSQIKIPPTGNIYMTEAQFMRLARKHKEAQLRAIRKVYRTFAANGGVGKLHMEQLQPAVTRLNRLFVNDLQDWLKTFRPGARVAKKHVTFDYEEFRIIALHCCDKLTALMHQNCSFSEVQLAKLRVEFVKFAKDGSSGEVDVTGLLKLFKVFFPQAQTSKSVHNRLKAALESNHAKTSGLDWSTFLRVLQTYDHLADMQEEHCIEAALTHLSIPDECIDKAQELLSLLTHVDHMRFTAREQQEQAKLTGKDLQFLVQGLAPGLTEEEANEALERLQYAETVSHEIQEDEYNTVVKLKQIILNGNLSKRSQRLKPHDVVS